jgi:hypothetical protein
LDQSTLLNCILDRWSGQIGDPNVMGWLTVVLYALVSVMAVVVLRTPGALAGRVRAFWWLVAVAMALLAVNKQIDLQSALTALGRCIALRDGWYETRGGFQRVVLLGLGAAALALLALGLYALRRDLRRNLSALLGLSFVAGFVMMRAVGYHGFDMLINTEALRLRLNWLFEWAGPLMVGANALFLRRRADPFYRLKK